MTSETTLETVFNSVCAKRNTSSIGTVAFIASHLISHVWQVFKAHWRTEHLVMHIHDLVLVTAGVQVVHCILYDIQSLVARCLQIVFGR